MHMLARALKRCVPKPAHTLSSKTLYAGIGHSSETMLTSARSLTQPQRRQREFTLTTTPASPSHTADSCSRSSSGRLRKHDFQVLSASQTLRWSVYLSFRFDVNIDAKPQMPNCQCDLFHLVSTLPCAVTFSGVGQPENVTEHRMHNICLNSAAFTQRIHPPPPPTRCSTASSSWRHLSTTTLPVSTDVQHASLSFTSPTLCP